MGWDGGWAMGVRALGLVEQPQLGCVALQPGHVALGSVRFGPRRLALVQKPLGLRESVHVFVRWRGVGAVGGCGRWQCLLPEAMLS